MRQQVLEVNGEPVFADELRLRPLEDVVDGILLRQEARRLRLMPAPEEIDRALAIAAPRFDGLAGCRADAADLESREEYTGRVMVDRLLARWCEAARPPKIHEIREYYRSHHQEFWTPESIAASHIVQSGISRAEDLDALRRLILSGEELFADVARRASDCPENGGDLGYFPRGVMVEAFDSIAFETPVGEISRPFQTQFGWHIVWVRDRKPEGIRPFEEVMLEIRERLTRELQEREVTAKLLSVRKRARILETA